MKPDSVDLFVLRWVVRGVRLAFWLFLIFVGGYILIGNMGERSEKDLAREADSQIMVFTCTTSGALINGKNFDLSERNKPAVFNYNPTTASLNGNVGEDSFNLPAVAGGSFIESTQGNNSIKSVKVVLRDGNSRVVVQTAENNSYYYGNCN